MARADVTEMPFSKLYPLLVAKAAKKAAPGKKWTRSPLGSPDTRQQTSHGWSSPASVMGTFSAQPPP